MILKKKKVVDFFMKNVLIDYQKNIKYDIFDTPVCGILPLLKYLPNDRKLNIWECCDSGKSNISMLLKELGHNVISTDIINGFDFIKDIPSFDFDMIITNPPYSIKDKWLKKCYEYGKPFALLLPLTALEGESRNKLYLEKGISIIVLNKRLDFTGKKNTWFNTSWFVWGFKSVNENSMIFENLNKKNN